MAQALRRWAVVVALWVLHRWAPEVEGAQIALTRECEALGKELVRMAAQLKVERGLATDLLKGLREQHKTSEAALRARIPPPRAPDPALSVVRALVQAHAATPHTGAWKAAQVKIAAYKVFPDRRKRDLNLLVEQVVQGI